MGITVAVAGGGGARALSRGNDDAYRVVVLRPATTDEVAADALARVQGELTAAGFDVRVVTPDPTMSVRDALESSGREHDSIATFAIVPASSGSSGAGAMEIWVSDRVTGKSVIETVRLETRGPSWDPKRGATVLAVQAVELLKASLAQYWTVPPRVAASAPAIAPPEPARADGDGAAGAFVTTGTSLQVGLAWLDSVGRVGPVWEPLLKICYGGKHGWAGRLAVGGLGSSTDLQTTIGTARLEQQMATVEILRAFRRGARVQLFASLGAGAYRMRVQGTGISPYVGNDRSSASVLNVAGAGVAINIASHVAFAMEAQGLLTWPHAIVELGQTHAGDTGWPAYLLSGVIVARL